MSFTVVQEWAVRKAADQERVLDAAIELEDHYRHDRPGVKFSLWLRSRDEPRRYLRITVFEDREAFERARDSEEAARFARELLAEVVESSFTERPYEVVLTRGGLDHERAR